MKEFFCLKTLWSWFLPSHEKSQSVNSSPLTVYYTPNHMLGTVHIVAVASDNISHSEFFLLKVKHINNEKNSDNNITITDKTNFQPPLLISSCLILLSLYCSRSSPFYYSLVGNKNQFPILSTLQILEFLSFLYCL